MKRILLSYTEAGELVDYALVAFGRIVLVSEQKGRVMVEEEFSSVEEMIENSCFIDVIDNDALATLVVYSTFKYESLKEKDHDRLQVYRTAA